MSTVGEVERGRWEMARGSGEWKQKVEAEGVSRTWGREQRASGYAGAGGQVLGAQLARSASWCATRWPTTALMPSARIETP
jgi:hypothetical protein